MVKLNVLLLATLIACALSLVTSRHQARGLFVELERAQALTRATPARVEKIAREQLKMQLPGPGRVQVIEGRPR